MCVIVYSPRNKETISKELLKAMFDANPDGAGLMWQANDKVNWYKGIFNFDRLYEAYLSLRADREVKDIVIHCRIATGSAVDGAHCHPFPVTSSEKRLKTLHGTTDVCMMHNGILGSSTYDMSDTMLFDVKELKPRWDRDNRWYLRRKGRRELEFLITGNRMVLMDAHHTELFGRWKTYNGYDVSNTNFTYRLKSNKSFYDYYDIDDDDAYDRGYVYTPTRNVNRFYTQKGKQHKSYIDLLYEQCYTNDDEYPF